MSGIWDFGQGVSKGFWSDAIGGPVDLSALAINAILAGYGSVGKASGLLKAEQMPNLIDRPVGGSEWIAEKMRRAGLLTDNPGSTADAYGRVTGGLMGPVVSAKAPEIARGLMAMQENASIPSMLNQQAGAIVYHGSPHKFDKFDSKKIGTGEGAQAYGHGLYLSDSHAVAKSYQDALQTSDSLLNGRKVLPTDENFQAVSMIAAHGYKDALAMAQRFTNPQFLTEDGLKGAQKLVDQIAALKGAKIADAPTGSIYKVDLPDTAIAKMLDWDKPLSQQSEALAAIGAKLDGTAIGNQLGVYKGKIPLAPLSGTGPSGTGMGSAPTGQDLYRRLHEAAILSGKAEPAAIKEMQATKMMRDAGIPGIKYLDQGSRTAGKGTYNYVVFPGEEQSLKILERNSKGLMSP